MCRLRERDKPHDTLQHGEVSLDAEAGSCTVSGLPVELTANEFALLELLLSYQDRIFSKEDLGKPALSRPGRAGVERHRSLRLSVAKKARRGWGQRADQHGARHGVRGAPL